MNSKNMKMNKCINGWTVCKKGDEFGAPGDVILLFNDTDGNRRKKIIPFGQDKWYFYVRNSQKSKEKLQRISCRTVEGKDWIRVYQPNVNYRDKDLKTIVDFLEREGVETYEADVSPMKRLCLDHDIQVEDWEKVRILYFDIETDDTEKGLIIGGSRILSFAGIDRDGKEYFLTHEDEKVLLNQIKELVTKFDMLIGWNSKDFDIPYLRARFILQRIQFDYLGNILHEDMMRRVQYFYSKDPEARQSITSYSLDSISNYFLKEGKNKREGKVIDMFKSDPQKFKEYNLQDCRLLKKLEDKLGTIKLTYMMFQWCGVFAQNWSMVKTIDNYVLAEANKKGVHFRTNLAQMDPFSKEEQPGEEFLGAFVLDPIPGFYEKVYDLDFKSLYPNIIRTFNISPETVYKSPVYKKSITTPKIVDEEGKVHGGLQFSRTEKGIIPSKISQLLQRREEIRSELKKHPKDSIEWRNLNVQQLIVKELSNSIYGVLGNKWFRSFSVPLAESITATGQYLIKYVKKINEEEGRVVLYGDTDSVFLTLKPKEEIQVVLSWINKKIEEHLTGTFGLLENHIVMDLDTSFDFFLIETKKKYVGKKGDKYKYVGMECIKRDTIEIAVEFQKELIDLLMEKEKPKILEKWVLKKRDSILNGEMKAEKITIRKKLTKEPYSYKAKTTGKNYTPPIHVRIAQRAIAATQGTLFTKSYLDDKFSEFSPGSIIPYIITSGAVGDKADGVHVSEYKGEWDRLYYWSNIIYPPLMRLLEAVHSDIEWGKHDLSEERKNLGKLKKK